jgi:cobalt-zinc-cadmium efflux system outer membrane protein
MHRPERADMPLPLAGIAATAAPPGLERPRSAGANRRRAALLGVLLSAAGLRAQSGSAELADLLEEALRNNPEIAAARKRYEASRQRPSQAASLPDPMLSPGYNSSGRPWPGAGLGRAPTSNIGFMLSQEIPFPGKRKLAGEVAAKEAEAEWQVYQQVQLSVVSRLKQAYYRRAYAFAAADVLERNLRLLETLLRMTEARYSVGKAAQQDVFKVQTQISILQARRLPLEREQRVREAEILSLLGRPPGSSLPRPAQLGPLSLTVRLEELYRWAGQNSPLLKREEKVIQRAELALNLARKQYYPDFALNGGYYNMGGMPPMYMLRADIKIPLYWFRKQRPAISEQAESLAASRRQLEAADQNVRFRIQDEYLLAQTSAQLVRLYSQAVIPQAGLALESSLLSYETGLADFLTVFANYITAVEYQMNYYEELLNLHLALARLEELTARPLLP